jgi:hypothetical protein
MELSIPTLSLVGVKPGAWRLRIIIMKEQILSLSKFPVAMHKNQRRKLRIEKGNNYINYFIFTCIAKAIKLCAVFFLVLVCFAYCRFHPSHKQKMKIIFWMGLRLTMFIRLRARYMLNFQTGNSIGIGKPMGIPGALPTGRRSWEIKPTW